MTQQQLGAAMGGAGYPMRQNTISKIESGERPVIIGEAVALAGILGRDLAGMLTEPPADEDVKHAIAAVGAAERQMHRLQDEADKSRRRAAEAAAEMERAQCVLADAKDRLAVLRRQQEKSLGLAAQSRPLDPYAVTGSADPYEVPARPTRRK